MATEQAQRHPAAEAAGTAALIAANARATYALRQRTLALLNALWRGLGTWHKPDVDRFAPQAAGIVAQAQLQMSHLTAAFLQAYGDRLGDHIAAQSLTDPTALRKVDPLEEYARPFVNVWTALGNGKSLPDAVQVGQERLDSLAATDVQLAKTHTAQKALSRDARIVGYRRVLEGPYSCGLCIVASTQRYHQAELMPVHPGCDCDVVPIYGDHDPGRLLNAGTLADVHDAVRQRFGVDSTAAREIPGIYNGKGDPTLYRDVIITHHHGEIGPVLGVRGQDFTGPSDL